jgi:hypothetical protein
MCRGSESVCALCYLVCRGSESVTLTLKGKRCACVSVRACVCDMDQALWSMYGHVVRGFEGECSHRRSYCVVHVCVCVCVRARVCVTD